MAWFRHILLVMCVAMSWPLFLSSCRSQKSVILDEIQLDSTRFLRAASLDFSLKLNDTIRILQITNGDTVEEKVIIRGAKTQTTQKDTTATIKKTTNKRNAKSRTITHKFTPSKDFSFLYYIIFAVIVLVVFEAIMRRLHL